MCTLGSLGHHLHVVDKLFSVENHLYLSTMYLSRNQYTLYSQPYMYNVYHCTKDTSSTVNYVSVYTYIYMYI